MRLLARLYACCYSSLCWGAPHWETIQTEHFNVHYTKGHQAWRPVAAQELETVRDIVLVQQKRSLPSVADVVVFDPYHGANGFALPSTDNNSHVNTLFIPDLSMAGLRGSHYQQFGTGVTWRANRP
ncbi:hypothetical protein [Pseudoalteromonas aurantia]|uniref:hypothetical protein n=1 Tax=Pseudoalteromonas aurantia TaxID=43654 RepID=UPI00110A3869|nr:hypothetical protein [Pseudoalteromonas aurantia]